MSIFSFKTSTFLGKLIKDVIKEIIMKLIYWLRFFHLVLNVRFECQMTEASFRVHLVPCAVVLRSNAQCLMAGAIVRYGPAQPCLQKEDGLKMTENIYRKPLDEGKINIAQLWPSSGPPGLGAAWEDLHWLYSSCPKTYSYDPCQSPPAKWRVLTSFLGPFMLTTHDDECGSGTSQSWGTAGT